MILTRALVIGLAIGLAPPAQALQLNLPAAARLTASREAPRESYTMAVSAWENGRIEVVLAEGALSQQAWILPATSLTTPQLVGPLREELVADGYTILFECFAVACGGFDFRYALSLLPEPDMHVDLGDFHYIAAELPGDPVSEQVSLVVSRSATAGYVHVTRIGPTAAQPSVIAPETTTVEAAPISNIARKLNTSDRAVLEDLIFGTGSATLDDVVFPSLIELADYLIRNPDARVLLVGHTDAEGSLENNIALSERRARAVAERLVTAHNVPPTQLEAEGVGPLAPRASNASEEGRAANRRVEVVKALAQ